MVKRDTIMIATKSDMNACYKAIQQFDETETVLLQAIDIMASMCTHDIYEALDKLKDRRGEFDTAIRAFRKRDRGPVLPETVGEFLGNRMQAQRDRRVARRSERVQAHRDHKAGAPWWEGERGAVQTPIDDDAGVEELRSDLTEVAFEAAEKAS